MVVGGFLGTLGGFVQLIIVGGANPHLLSTEFTLSLLVMVVLGGAGSRWGPLIGGALYVLLDNRLQELSTSRPSPDLPAVLRVPLSQPVFVLGPAVRPGGLLRAGRDRRDRRPGAVVVVAEAAREASAAPVERAPERVWRPSQQPHNRDVTARRCRSAPHRGCGGRHGGASSACNRR